MEVAIYVAIAENGVIGRDNGLPWKLSSDLKRFKADTMGKPIIMGRKTFESIGKPLPGRLNIVVSRDPAYRIEGAETAQSVGDAITLATVKARCMPGADEICVIGGGEIYRLALPLAHRLHVTHVLASPDGDTRFPAIESDKWVVESSQEFPAGEKDSHATRYTVYRRRSGGH